MYMLCNLEFSPSAEHNIICYFRATNYTYVFHIWRPQTCWYPWLNIIANRGFLEKTCERKDLEGRKLILTWFHRPERLYFNSLYCNLAYCMHKKNTVMWYVWCSHTQIEESIKENVQTGVPWWLVLYNALFFLCIPCQMSAEGISGPGPC